MRWHKIIAFGVGAVIIYFILAPVLKLDLILTTIAIVIYGAIVALSGKIVGLVKHKALIEASDAWCEVKDHSKLMRGLREQIAETNGIDLVDVVISINFLRRAHIGIASIGKPGQSKQWCGFNPAAGAKPMLLTQLMDFESLNRWLGTKSVSQVGDLLVPRPLSLQRLEFEISQKKETKKGERLARFGGFKAKPLRKKPRHKYTIEDSCGG